MDHRPLAPVTVNSTLTPLSAMLTDAVDAGLLGAPTRRASRAGRATAAGASRCSPTPAEAPKHLEPVEALALLGAAPVEHRAMVLAALTTGARRGELLALRWEGWTSRTVGVDRRAAAGPRARRLQVRLRARGPLYSGLARLLGPRRRAEGYVFLAPDGGPWGNQGPEREFLRQRTSAPSCAGRGRCGTSCGTRTRACWPPAACAATSSRS